MRRSLKGEGPGRICISIAETTLKNTIEAIKEANRLADLIELRIDYLKECKLTSLLNGRKKSFIVTNRRREEGGKYRGAEKRRVGVLEEAIQLGAEYIDVEIQAERPLLQDLIANKKETQVILSLHNFKETPSQKELRILYDRMARLESDIVKIVTLARSWEDNLRVLSLIPYANKKKQKIVAFCMGEKGRMSRLFAPLFGAAWTYASLSEGRASAPGQMTVMEMRDIWERFR